MATGMEICPICDGSGDDAPDPNIRYCPPCPACGGSGKLPMIAPAPIEEKD